MVWISQRFILLEDRINPTWSWRPPPEGMFASFSKFSTRRTFASMDYIHILHECLQSLLFSKRIKELLPLCGLNPNAEEQKNIPHQLIHLLAEPLRLIGHPADGGLEGVEHLQVLLLLRRLAGHREQLQGQL